MDMGAFLKQLEGIMGEAALHKICLGMRKEKPDNSLYCIKCDKQEFVENLCVTCIDDNYGIPFVENEDETFDRFRVIVNNYLQNKGNMML